MKSLKCCKKIMRCYNSRYIHYGDWTPKLTHFFQCMKCGKLKESKEK